MSPDPAPPHAAPAESARVGLAFGLGAYGWWAFVFPLHLKALNAVSDQGIVASRVPWSMEVLAHRLVWSVLLCLGLTALRGRLPVLRSVLRNPRAVGLLALTATLVTLNWLVFIVAMARGELYRAGIGYFVTPIVQIGLGTLFLGERLRRGQWAAVGLAVGGMLVLVVVGGNLPWIEAGLALTFGFYGLLRKRSAAGPIVGLTVETGILAPCALVWLWWAPEWTGVSSGWGEGGATARALLALTGVSTTVPLLWFAAAAQRLPLSTVGFLQFLAPTGQFVLSVLAFGERPPDARLWFGYGLIWAGVAALSAEGLRAWLRTRRALVA